MAWAKQVEFQLGEGNAPSFEIKSWESTSGHTEEHTLSDDACDYSEVWEAWVDGEKENAVQFLVPEGSFFDVAQKGADELGVDLSESVNVQRV